MGKDSRQVSAETEVTPEMVEAGLCVLQESGRISGELSSDRLLVQELLIASIRQGPKQKTSRH